ncbi:unnamed protein product [Protopolystoma xenopodis]|uniref:Uncharacterized protein n=1 Tax=Protopolystoma xenopodis TaxID=117903 RepID=A0A3S5A6Q1_9PLAT|nr:unnamed protein product [Protopolystoma xenopodis]
MSPRVAVATVTNSPAIRLHSSTAPKTTAGGDLLAGGFPVPRSSGRTPTDGRPTRPTPSLAHAQTRRQAQMHLETCTPRVGTMRDWHYWRVFLVHLHLNTNFVNVASSPRPYSEDTTFQQQSPTLRWLPILAGQFLSFLPPPPLFPSSATFHS